MTSKPEQQPEDLATLYDRAFVKIRHARTVKPTRA
jgi:hypothetical protein